LTRALVYDVGEQTSKLQSELPAIQGGVVSVLYYEQMTVRWIVVDARCCSYPAL